jgi:hypothetical protein
MPVLPLSSGKSNAGKRGLGAAHDHEHGCNSGHFCIADAAPQRLLRR